MFSQLCLSFILSLQIIVLPISQALAAVPPQKTLEERLKARAQRAPATKFTSLIFDLPLTYNKKVSFWISYFQSKGKNWFRDWLERSSKYMPFIQKELKNAGLPQDLAFMVMIESGFLPTAVSHANAVGPWQFMQATGERYGLKVNSWLDERRDLKKSTLAAIRYIQDLYQEFGSWYLVAASYNMGENGLRRQIVKRQTRDFWTLSQSGALPQETMDYVPKILAVMMIAKSPALYGFRDLAQFEPLDYDIVSVPGGTDLANLATKLGVTTKSLKDLNAELTLGYIPSRIESHTIRVPKGSINLVAQYLEGHKK
ncbi:MAG: murein transglycosylase [Bdellovibrio sp. CG10_big_fil_rev_8_21_14_0_10_47_8]|nr:MAG: murein transglycosylase [Bdellovibrio sp. CG10_big_fil_rev_8_21_14_0_10_47_8]